MSNSFDATLKHLVETQPAAWLEYIGMPGENVQVIDADLSTLTAEADKVLHVPADQPFLVHLEFQTGYEVGMGRRMLRYNVLLNYRHDLPVESVLLLLRREADGPALTGQVDYRRRDGRAYLSFEYTLVRVWEKSAEEVLAGGLATLPLAPLANVVEGELPAVIRRMEEQIERTAPPGEAGVLWSATYLLMGLKYERAFIHQLLKGVQGMKESVTYQAILEEGAAIGEARGKAEEARRLVLRLGSKRYGSPDAQTQATIEAVDSLEQLEQLAERLLEAENWQELLQ